MINNLNKMLHLAGVKKSVINESKQTEQQGQAILTKAGFNNEDINDVINNFRNNDTTSNQILIPMMAKAMIELSGVDNQDYKYHLDNINSTFKSVGDLINLKKIDIPTITDRGYIVNNNTYKDFLGFSEFIHGLEGMETGFSNMKGEIKTDTKEPPLREINGINLYTSTNNTIKVYDGNDVGKCISHSSGNLTGKRYNFCIGQPLAKGNMWQSYRDSKTSTFYYIIDENRTLDDPLHIVVVDITDTRGKGVELTDKNNTTGTIAEYGTDYQAYFNYLQSKGINTDAMVNKPKSPEEIADQEKLGRSNTNLDWFLGLTYKEKSRYVGRGHLLSDDQFNWIWKYRNSDGGKKLMHQYLDTGQAIPESQFNLLTQD